MKRRRLIWTIGVGAATASLAGCTATDGTGDGTTEPLDGDTDVSVTLVRNAPENPGPFEDPVGTVRPQESEELALDRFTFQRAGQKGLVVVGDATNIGDRQLRDLAVEVTLHDTNENEDELLDSATERASRERLDTGETWQWATTFDEQEFQIDYYIVRATASYV